MTFLSPKRLELKYNFLKGSLKTERFNLKPILSDASMRSYYRIFIGDKTYILMNCPKEHYCLKPFIKIAKLLKANSLNVPEIYHIDYDNGFLILEDFGDVSVRKYLNGNLSRRCEIYELIIDTLIKLQSIKHLNDLPLYDSKLFLTELQIYLDWYVPRASGKYLCDNQKNEFYDIWEKILSKLPQLPGCLVFRDFHVENMMLINKGDSPALGLIDFQDALIGSPVYDLVSVLEDARIRVGKMTAKKYISLYSTLNTDMSLDDILISYNILGAQRNCKILGIFARKHLRDGNKKYLKYIPRVGEYLKNDLSHEVMSALRLWVSKFDPIIN